MKQNTFKLTLAFALITLLMPAKAQSTLGKDFWVSFLPHGEHIAYSTHGNNLELVVIGKRPCSGRVTNPNTQWSTTFEVQPGASTVVSIPIEGNYINNPAGFQDDSDCILNHGLHVVTTDSVSLYASNKISSLGEENSEATCVLPTQSLGSEYIIQTYPSLKGNASDLSEFCIVATQNNTLVDINLAERSYGHYANMPFFVVLQAGQCYQILSASSYLTDRDFSGTHIKVRNGKRIAVFAGNNAASYYHYSDASNYLHHHSEQMLPVSTWGQKFIVAGTQESRKGKVRITALNNACNIKRNGVSVATINARKTFDYEITSSTQADFIETSEPAQVFQYLTLPYNDLGTMKDGCPAMVLISPLEQRIKDAAFCTFAPSPACYYQNQNHYVNIVTETNCVSSMKLDGHNIASQFHPTPYNSGYSYARIQIQHGTHTLSSAAGGTNGGGFVAQVYGLGTLGCYAFSAGSMVINQSAQIMVDQQYSTNFTNGFWFCEDDIVNFSLFTNYEVSRAEWSFGDNATGTGVEIAHQYPEAGNYNVSCDVYKSTLQGQDSLMGTLTTKIHVQQHTEQEVYETDCDFHNWQGETYTESGVYTYHGHSIGGCDSIVNLHLTLHPTVTVPYDTAICDQYEWYDWIYTQSGVYTHVEGQTDFGCDSIAELYLTIKHAPQITIDGPRQVYAATDVPSGTYLYQVSDSLNIAPNTLEWVCSNPEWIVKPLGEGYSCRLHVTISGQGTLKVITHNTTDCNTSSSIEINATYFDVDDNEAVKVTLFPNPAQTTVSLVASQLQRVRIYNSIGQNLMDIPANHPDRLDVDVSALKQGIYIVEISTSVGKTTQRLSILR